MNILNLEWSIVEYIMDCTTNLGEVTISLMRSILDVEIV